MSALTKITQTRTKKNEVAEGKIQAIDQISNLLPLSKRMETEQNFA